MFSALLSACNSTYREPHLADHHPANPVATEAPVSIRSQTLDLADADPIYPASARSTTGHAGHAIEGASTSPHQHDAPTPAHGESAIIYVCPMHPEVTSDKPDARCPKCGMKLVQKSDAEGGR